MRLLGAEVRTGERLRLRPRGTVVATVWEEGVSAS